MKGLTLLLAVAAIAVALSLPADRATREAVACTYINAFDAGADADTVRVGDYITITGTSNCSTLCDESHSCGGEALYTCYGITRDSACPPLGSGPTGCVQGNNLSGHYQVAVKTGRCLKLCACSG